MISLSLKASDIFISFLSILTSIKPYQYLFFFLFLQPFLGFTRNEDIDLFKHFLFRFFSLSLLLYTLFYFSHHYGRIIFVKTGLEPYLAVYIVGVLFSTMSAIAVGNAVVGRMILSLLTVPILVSLFYTSSYWFNDRGKIRIAIRYFLNSVFVVCIIGIIEFIVLSVSGTPINIRLNSVFVDPNIFARYVLLGIFFVIPLLFYKDVNIFSRKTLIFFLILFLLNLLLSLSRSGYLTFIIGCVVFALFIDNRKIKSLMIGGSIAVGLLIFAYLMTQRSFAGSALVEPSNINRIQLILGGLDIIQSHWLFGIGYTNFGNYFEKQYLENILSVSSEAYREAGMATEIHSWIIEVWAEQGIIGLGIFCLLFYKIFSLINTARKRETNSTHRNILMGFILLFFTFIFHGFFYHTFISQFFFWVVGGLGIATARITLNEM
jgi:O-antigen ligase